MNMDRVCVLGMGYVGLTLAVVMAECGHEVIGIEIDPDKARTLAECRAHFFEAGLQARLASQVRSGRLRFTSDHHDSTLADCQVFIVTVGTPLNSAGEPRMDMVERAVGQVADVMPSGALVILRSTVKLGTTRTVAKPILDATGMPYDLAYCPERTIEGKALAELRCLPQVVGGIDQDSAWRAAGVFQHITPTTIRVSSLEAAELIKLLDNSYRDLFFAFGNEVALICEAAGLNGREVIQAANTGYERTSIAPPGLVGGPCLEKDPHILAASMRDVGYTPRLISTGRRLNEELPQSIMHLLEPRLLHLADADIVITICGVAYKGRPETDDVRGTPVSFLISALRERFPKAVLRGQDFAVGEQAIAALGLESVGIAEAFDGAHLVIVTNNNARYSELDMGMLLPRMAARGLVLDVWDCLPIVDEAQQASVLTLGSINAAQRSPG